MTENNNGMQAATQEDELVLVLDGIYSELAQDINAAKSAIVSEVKYSAVQSQAVEKDLTAKLNEQIAAIKALADKLGELMTDKSQGPVFICHADCGGDATLLSSMIKETYGLDTDITVFTGPVIGAHAGPGVVALFFLGEKR